MSAAFELKDAEKQLAAINLPLLVKHHANEQGFTLNKLSGLLGKDRSYLSQHLTGKTVSLTLLYAISHHLHINLLEPICNLLPESIQPSPREKALQQQIDALQQELATIKRERDLLEKIAMR